MDHSMCVSLSSHPLYYYWYKVGMFKVPEASMDCCRYSQHFQQSFGRQFCSWSAEQGNVYFPVPVRALEFGLSRYICLVVPSRDSPLIYMVLTHGIPPASLGGVLHRQPQSGQSRVNDAHSFQCLQRSSRSSLEEGPSGGTRGSREDTSKRCSQGPSPSPCPSSDPLPRPL